MKGGIKMSTKKSLFAGLSLIASLSLTSLINNTASQVPQADNEVIEKKDGEIHPVTDVVNQVTIKKESDKQFEETSWIKTDGNINLKDTEKLF